MKVCACSPQRHHAAKLAWLQACHLHLQEPRPRLVLANRPALSTFSVSITAAQETPVKDPTSPDSPQSTIDTSRGPAAITSLSRHTCSFMFLLRHNDLRSSKVHMRCTDISQPPAPPIPRFITIHQGACGLSSGTPGGPRLSLYCWCRLHTTKERGREGVRKRKTEREGERAGFARPAVEWREVQRTASFWKSSYSPQHPHGPGEALFLFIGSRNPAELPCTRPAHLQTLEARDDSQVEPPECSAAPHKVLRKKPARMCSQQGPPSQATDMVRTTCPSPEALSKAGKLSSSAQHGPTHNLVNPSFPGSNVPGSVHEKQWESQPKPQHNQKDLQKNWEKQQPVISTVGQGFLRYLVLCSVVSNSFRTPGL